MKLSTSNGAEGRAPRVFVHTFGCQMNVDDSRRMVQLLTGLPENGRDGASGRAEVFETAASPAEADLILINTCSVRERPREKVRHVLGRYSALREHNPGLVIGVTGCVAAQDGEALFARAPQPDFVLGPDWLTELPALVAEARRNRAAGVESRAALAAERPVLEHEFVEAHPIAEESVTAMVTVMKGCDSFCSYCIVPYVRGREVSKPCAQVLREVERLVAAGVREVTLLGQNVNRYGLDLRARRGGAGPSRLEADEPLFPELLARVAALPGLARLRFTTSHPRDLSPALIDCFGALPELCEYLHLPVQAGADSLLARMGRGYTRATYLERVAALRRRCPEIHLSADVIVGFPGETEREFRETLTLVEEVGFETLFSFKYSPRPGTAAFRLADDVPESLKAERLAELQALQERRTSQALAAQVGRDVEVLVEGPSRTARRTGGGQLFGRTRGNHVVNFDLPESAEGVPAGALTGRLATVRLERALKHSLYGRVSAYEEPE